MPLIHLVFALAAAQLAPRADTLRIVLIVDDTASRSSLVHGAVLGGEEAMHTGALFGTPAELRVVQAPDSASVVHALARTPGPSVVIAAGSARTCDAAFALSAAARTIVFDAGCERGASAADTNVYALVSFPTATPADDSTRLELWHSTLERFGAEQLNQRYRRRFGAAMDAPAWAGWVACKIALDLALRARSATAPAILARLRGGRQQFDGQKGRPIYFAPDTRRLVQPLYRVVGSGASEHVAAEVNP